MKTKINLAITIKIYMRSTYVKDSATWNAKLNDFAHLLHFLADGRDCKEVDLHELTPAAIADFVKNQLKDHYAETTINRQLASYSAFCKHAAEKFDSFPCPHIKFLSVQQAEPRGVTAEEKDRLIHAAGEFGSTEWDKARNKFIVSFLFNTGLRIDELRRLKLSQIEGDYLRKVRGKGDKFRDVFLSEKCRALITDYLEWRTIALERAFGCKAYSASLPVLVTIRDQPSYEALLMNERTLSWTIRAIATRANVPSFTAHVARHQRCKYIIEKTHDLPLAADQLGHSDVKITMRYARLKESDVRRKLGNG